MAPDPESKSKAAALSVERGCPPDVAAARAEAVCPEAASAYSRRRGPRSGSDSTAHRDARGSAQFLHENTATHGEQRSARTRPEQLRKNNPLDTSSEQSKVPGTDLPVSGDEPPSPCEHGTADAAAPMDSGLPPDIFETGNWNDVDPEVVAFYRLLITEGRLQPGDSGVSLDSKPSWVDDAKVRLGQQFTHKYFYGLMFAEMSSLFLLFTAPGAVQPLIFSDNSTTPVKAFQRYLSTVGRVCAWYSGDLWAAEGEARRELSAVRRLHDVYRRRLNALNAADPEERARCTALPDSPLWTRGAADAVREAFAAEDRALGYDPCPFFSMIASRHEWINQMEMSVTQFGFVALAVTYPERFGAGGASDEELDAFVHLWRVLGHLLGVQDRFNFCAGGLDAVRKRSKALVKRFLAPALAQVDASWEHMTRCVVEGVSYYVGGMTYEVALLYLCETVDVPAPRVLSTLSAQQRRMHRVAAFLLRWALRVAPVRALFNWLLNLGIKRALAASPDWLRRREARVYDYERARPAHAQRL